MRHVHDYEHCALILDSVFKFCHTGSGKKVQLTQVIVEFASRGKESQEIMNQNCGKSR